MSERFVKASEVNFPDGIISGLGITISGGTNIAVALGIWRINNVLYQTGAITTLTPGAADPVDNRIDLIYANASNQVLLLAGTVAVNPVKPAVPANCTEVGNVLVTPTGYITANAAAAEFVTMAEFNTIVGNIGDLITDNTSNLVGSLNGLQNTLNGLNQDNVILTIFKKSNYS